MVARRSSRRDRGGRWRVHPCQQIATTTSPTPLFGRRDLLAMKSASRRQAVPIYKEMPAGPLVSRKQTSPAAITAHFSRKVPSEVGVVTPIPRRVLSEQGRYAFSGIVSPDEVPTPLIQGKCCPSRADTPTPRKMPSNTGPTPLLQGKCRPSRADTPTPRKMPPNKGLAHHFQGNSQSRTRQPLPRQATSPLGQMTTNPHQHAVTSGQTSPTISSRPADQPKQEETSPRK